MSNIPDMLEQAKALHMGGQTRQAEEIYRRILQIAPNHADAMQLVGVLMCQAGNPWGALPLLQKSVEIKPTPLGHANLGICQRMLGERVLAVESYRAAMRLDPRDSETFEDLTAILRETETLDEANAHLAPEYPPLTAPGAIHPPGKLIALFHTVSKVGTAWSCTEGVIQTLRRMGHRVMDCQCGMSAGPNLQQLKRADLILLIGLEWFDDVIRIRYDAGWRELKMPKIAWYIESFQRDRDGFNFNVMREFADAHFFPAIQDAEQNKGEWLPFGVDTEMFKQVNIPKTHDAAFLGSIYAKRTEFLKRIDFPITCLPKIDPPHPIQRFEQLAAAYSSIKVFVNLPAYSRLLVTKVTEVMACGTFLMTPELDRDWARGNMAPFEHGKHLIYYPPENPPEIAGLIKYYLDHEAERQAIARAGYEEILKNHRLELRLEKILRHAGIAI
jgi:hypothetical protein